MSGAQQAFASLKQDLKTGHAHRHHHHQAPDASSSANTTQSTSADNNVSLTPTLPNTLDTQA
jgi:hypothetical protein